MKKIDHLAVGSGIRYRNQKWLVTDKSNYVESADYRETQWTLLAPGNRMAYLIQSDEKTDHGLEQIWIFTYPVAMDRVRFKNSKGDWMLFSEGGSMIDPPATAALDETIFALKGQSSGQARDDDGNLVTKLTWDYYDDSGARNLAIEVWKEEDGDYPEAYDGVSIAPDEIAILEATEVAGIRRQANEDLKGLAVAAGYSVAGLVMVWTAGIPLDVCLAAAVPLVAFFRVFQKGSVLVASVITIMVGILGCTVYLSGGSAQFWSIAGLSLLLGIILPNALARIVGDMALLGVEDEVWCVLPPLWGVSFYMYFMYAPGPRDAAQLTAAVVLPLLLSALICFINQSLRKRWANKA